MPFRARSINDEGRFGSPVTIAGYQLTGESQVFMGKMDAELGFGVPPVELCQAGGVVLETLDGPVWPGCHADRSGKGEGKGAMLNAFRDGTWPTASELVLQANVTAKLDPKTRPMVLKQHFLRQGLPPEQADREVERRLRPGSDAQLLDGVKPIVPKLRAARTLPAATGTADAGESVTPAEARAKREAAAGKPAARGAR